MTRALVVDDRGDNRYLLRALLEGHGYTVDEARHGAEALAIARQTPPQLVITDLLMPVMDGYTLLRHWKADARLKQIPFVVYTATYTEPQDERLALDLGADAFILKPAEPEPFMARIGEVLAKRELGELAPARAPADDEKTQLKEYSEVLMRKLEQKALQLEHANRVLQEDVDRRISIEAALAESGRFAQATLDAVPGNLCVIDRNGVIVFVNAAWNQFAQANGAVPQAVGVGRNYLGVCRHAAGPRSEDAAVFAAKLDAVLSGGLSDFDMEYPCHSPEVKRWFIGRVTRFPGDDPVRAVVLHIDVTSRKRTQEALREAYDKLDVLVDSSPLAILGVDSAGRILSWNVGAERMFGWSEAEAVGQVCPTVPPDGLEDYRAMIGRVMHGETVSGLVRYRQKKDGTRIHASLNAAALHSATGETTGAILILEDVTARMQAEEALRASEYRYRNLFENMLEGFAYCRMIFENGRPRDWIYVEVNPAFEKLTGLKGVAGKNVTEIIPGIRESNPQLIERFGRLASTGKPDNFETYVDGLKRWFSISAFCPEPGYFVAVFEMITERKAAEQKLRDYTAELQSLSRKLLSVQEEERRVLARELHDEVGQTLTALKINLQVLGREQEMAPVLPAFDECVGIADHALAQVRTLMLDLRPPQLEELGLAVALRTHAERRLAPAGLVLHFRESEVLPALTPEIEIECFRIAQEALTNILRHAGARQVWMELAADGELLRLSVRDDGKGFDYHESRARAARGSSMGLLGMEERAALAGGRIEFSTAPNAGTTLRAEFPLSPVAATAATTE